MIPVKFPENRSNGFGEEKVDDCMFDLDLGITNQGLVQSS
jgi:hypothetical protein